MHTAGWSLKSESCTGQARPPRLLEYSREHSLSTLSRERAERAERSKREMNGTTLFIMQLSGYRRDGAIGEGSFGNCPTSAYVYCDVGEIDHSPRTYNTVVYRNAIAAAARCGL
jgi:hypothetical protein